jgi:hypothetical protein
VALSDTGKTPRHDCQGLKCVPSRVTRRSYNGQTGDEILSVRSYRGGREDQ